jgi:N4-gp56 family major capsid protein
MARIIDTIIQDEVMAWTNVRYSGTATSRWDIAVTDTLNGKDLIWAYTQLDTLKAPKIDGYYVAILHPHTVYDLKQDTAVTGFIETNKYVTPEKMIKWEIGAINGCRIITSANVKTFSSTVTVYPTLVLGRGAYWVPKLNSLQTFITPRTASDSDPLAQRVKVGSKVAFVAKILQENAMLRIESATSFQ